MRGKDFDQVAEAIGDYIDEHENDGPFSESKTERHMTAMSVLWHIRGVLQLLAKRGE